MVRCVVSSRAWKSRRNSLTVNVIRPAGVGVVSRSVAVATAKNAWASMARAVQRCQDFQRRTWCWSSPTRRLAAWKDSLSEVLDAAETGPGTLGSHTRYDHHDP